MNLNPQLERVAMLTVVDEDSGKVIPDLNVGLVKFWMSIEFTVALPRWPRHQLVAFIDRQSGGHLFDNGGVDTWGFDYRLEF